MREDKYDADVDPSRCPLCGGDNRCAILQGAEIDSCWCRAAAIPRGLLERVPAERAGQACICAACVAAYHRETATGR
ncbi:hypothetical protein PA598K_03520 [Paenibacillus sp. 598K]|uniref:cysteine-rich CWC family protein n=1 Tax=Paenibacillus sp. 598K TaxID=1117987 RepID=UPI000FF9AEFA|nr:cysteine-rich CWC family protein [Paenibacillus sp. 598K]GBF75135.1 hypothetical protein PA598K_03520 [Paenibacillus sp. 598K]